MELGMQMGLGTDVAAGSSLSLFRAMAMAIQCSKLRWRLVDQNQAPLTVEEVFYLATKGGGAFFGKAGSLEEGYEFDAVVIDDRKIRHARPLFRPGTAGAPDLSGRGCQGGSKIYQRETGNLTKRAFRVPLYQKRTVGGKEWKTNIWQRFCRF